MLFLKYFYFPLSLLCLSNANIGFKILVLFASKIHPLLINSSTIKCAFSKLNIISNSHTFSKYLSKVSTILCINSNKLNSLQSSFKSKPNIKYKEAYLLYIIL